MHYLNDLICTLQNEFPERFFQHDVTVSSVWLFHCMHMWKHNLLSVYILSYFWNDLPEASRNLGAGSQANYVVVISFMLNTDILPSECSWYWDVQYCWSWCDCAIHGFMWCMHVYTFQYLAQVLPFFFFVSFWFDLLISGISAASSLSNHHR